MKLLVIALCVVGWVVASTAPARACGAWTMEDVEKGNSIHWLVNSGTISKGKRKLGALYLDIEKRSVPRVVAGKKTVFDIVAGKLQKRGKSIGTVNGTTITIGKASYVVELGARGDYHGLPAWPLEVIRKGTTPVMIIETDEAPDLCAVANRASGIDFAPDDDASQKRIIARIAYYLAWRQLGA
jgi:hypothetical protein